MRELPGKVAIVSGGGLGTGYAAAQGFAAEGAKVVMADVLGLDGERSFGRSAPMYEMHFS